MKRFGISLAVALLAGAAFCDNVADIKAGTDLAVRCAGGTYTVGALGAFSTGDLIPTGGVTTLVHIPKTANTLVVNLPTGTLFPSLGISTNLTFTGATDSTVGGIAWTVTDPTAVGQTISVKYNGTTYPVVITSVSGTIYSVASILPLPVLDPFDHNYRGSQINDDASQVGGHVLISGTAYGSIPVTVSIDPIISGIGGVAGPQFVLNATVDPNNNINLVSGQTYTGVVTLELPAAADTTVTFSSLLLYNFSACKVLKGSKTGTFSFSTNTVGSTVPGWLIAGTGGRTFVRPLNVLPLLQSITAVTSPILSGGPVTFSVNLNAAAPTGGAVVKLHSDDPNLIFPASVTVPATMKNVLFTVTPGIVSTGTTTTAVTNTYVTAIYGAAIVRTLISIH